METKLNTRWLTHESDEERWENFRLNNSLPVNDFGPIISTSYRDESNDEENRDRFASTTGSSFHSTYEQADITNRNISNSNNGNHYLTSVNNNNNNSPLHQNTIANSRL